MNKATAKKIKNCYDIVYSEEPPHMRVARLIVASGWASEDVLGCKEISDPDRIAIANSMEDIRREMLLA